MLFRVTMRLIVREQMAEILENIDGYQSRDESFLQLHKDRTLACGKADVVINRGRCRESFRKEM